MRLQSYSSVAGYYGFSGSCSFSGSDAYNCMGRKHDIDARAKSDHAEPITLPDRIAFLKFADDSSGKKAGNLIEEQFYFFAGYADFHFFIAFQTAMVERHHEHAWMIVQTRNRTVERYSVDMHIEGRHEYADEH